MKTIARAAAVAAFTINGSVAAITPSATAQAAPVASDTTASNVASATGWTDVKSLTIVPISADAEIDFTKAAVKGTVTPVTVTPPTHTTYTNAVTCGTRKDWYRVIDSTAGGLTHCYANDGELHFKTIKGDLLCPGNNVGAVLWTKSSGITDIFRWSVPRSGYGDYNRCYSFGHTVYIDAVRLNR